MLNSPKVRDDSEDSGGIGIGSDSATSARHALTYTRK